MSDSFEIAEKFIILLLGAKNNPVPGRIHYQKELFILSKMKPKLQQLFSFQKHYKGPYSQLLDDLLESPVHYEDAYRVDKGKITLTEQGRRNLNDIKKELSSDKKANELIVGLKLVRELYDKLNENELLFLIYSTYPEYTRFSDISNNLLKRGELRRRILESLMRKGAITQERYEELRKN